MSGIVSTNYMNIVCPILEIFNNFYNNISLHVELRMTVRRLAYAL
jgi:hypothetical protein